MLRLCILIVPRLQDYVRIGSSKAFTRSTFIFQGLDVNFTKTIYASTARLARHWCWPAQWLGGNVEIAVKWRHTGAQISKMHVRRDNGILKGLRCGNQTCKTGSAFGMSAYVVSMYFCANNFNDDNDLALQALVDHVWESLRSLVGVHTR